jgi:hypothetical protein
MSRFENSSRMVRSVKEHKSSNPTRWIVTVVLKQGIAAYRRGTKTGFVGTEKRPLY